MTSLIDVKQAGFQINRSIAKRSTVFIWLLHETQPHSWSFLPDASDEAWSEVFHEAFAGPQREDSADLFEVELLSRTQNRFSALHELTGAVRSLRGGPSRHRGQHESRIR